MAAPPAKRQRRLAVESSSEESDHSEASAFTSTKPPARKAAAQPKSRSNGLTLRSSNGASTSSLPSRSRPTATTRPSIPKKRATPTPTPSTTKTTPTSSPEKVKAKRPKAKAEGEKSRSLHTFFRPATEEERWKRTEEERNVRDGSTSVRGAEDLDDLIEDDDDDEACLELAGLSQGNGARRVLDRRKENVAVRKGDAGMRKESGGGLSKASRRYLPVRKDGGGAVKGDNARSAGANFKDQRPWAEQYGPTSLEELAVHKKKVADVRTCLSDVLNGRIRQRLLVLKGPAGSGKTTTVNLLSQSLGFEVNEWRNPPAAEISSEGYLSMAAQFGEFLGRSGKFASLELEHSTGGAPASVQEEDMNKDKLNSKRKVILVEEFPNTFTRSSTALQSFRSSILQYLAANTPTQASLFSSSSASKQNASASTPLVLIISETLLTTSTASADSFTAHRLLGPEILTHPGTAVFEFNPIAPTFMTKALDLVVQKEARQSKRRRIPGPAVLKRLGELGDIRNAIGSLEFLCLRGDEGSDWSGRVAAKGKKSTKDASVLTAMEKESLELVTQREASLGMFHAVGKVVYNKRLDPADEVPQPPAFLPEHARVKSSEVDVDRLIDETGTDTSTFTAALHENYILSCAGSSFTDSFNGCIDTLSDSDLLSLDRRNGYRGTYQGAGADSLRQDGISFQVAVRGLVFFLPYPVKRQSHPVGGGRGTGKGDTYKMFYPTSARLWRQKEEMQSLLLAFTARSFSGNTITASDKNGQGSGVETWRNRNKNFDTSTSEEAASASASDAIRLGGTSARDETLLERLPYMARILQSKNSSDARVKDLQRIVQFHGVESQIDEEVSDVEDEEMALPVAGEAESWATDAPVAVDDRVRAGRRGGNPWQAREAAGSGSQLEAAGEAVRGLVLSDDDIEDF